MSEDPPVWALIAFNALDWLAVAFIEPFYVGAGFGLYLNRRTQLEAWDLEIAFRRMRKRLEAVGTSVLLALALCLPMAMPAHARDDNTCPFLKKAFRKRASQKRPRPERLRTAKNSRRRGRQGSGRRHRRRRAKPGIRRRHPHPAPDLRRGQQRAGGL